ncbi:MAG: hypothetical protein R2809_11085 [Flavobacteriales bacterium]
MEEVFHRKYKFMDENDSYGRFTGEALFEMKTMPSVNRFSKFRTKLKGVIGELQDGSSQVTLMVYRGFGFYFWFVICIIYGIVNLIVPPE